MTQEEFDILCSDDFRMAIEMNLDRHPNDIALDKRVVNSGLVATQIKYLQRSRTKLPSYYAARCIIPSKAFEQSSSEAAAETKEMIAGERALDLTCGLGVDTLALSKRFAKVITLERDELVAAVAKENFRRLGIANIEVVCSSAEEYLQGCEEQFDWVYVDPDRRGADGSKQVLLEDCSPNIRALMGELRRVSGRVAIKCSPMFDCDEAFRLFEGCDVEVVSVGDECKEVVIYASTSECNGRVERIGATSVEHGSVWFDRSDEDVATPPPAEFRMEAYSHLLIPNVALQKGRLARRVLSEVCDIWSDNGYGFATQESLTGYDPQRHLSRVLPIEAIYSYNPKVLRRELSSRGVKRADILKREFPHDIRRITSQLKISEGGVAQLAFTQVAAQPFMIVLKKV